MPPCVHLVCLARFQRAYHTIITPHSYQIWSELLQTGYLYNISNTKWNYNIWEHERPKEMPRVCNSAAGTPYVNRRAHTQKKEKEGKSSHIALIVEKARSVC